MFWWREMSLLNGIVILLICGNQTRVYVMSNTPSLSGQSCQFECRMYLYKGRGWKLLLELQLVVGRIHVMFKTYAACKSLVAAARLAVHVARFLHQSTISLHYYE